MSDEQYVRELEDKVTTLESSLTEMRAVANQVADMAQDCRTERDAALAASPEYAVLSYIEGLRNTCANFNHYSVPKPSYEDQAKVRVASARLSQIARCIKSYYNNTKPLYTQILEMSQRHIAIDAKKAAAAARKAARAKKAGL